MPFGHHHDDRVVVATIRDRNDDITGFSGDWGICDREQIFDDIESERHRYIVIGPTGTRTPVTSRRGSTDVFLWANWDDSALNNLDDLPRRGGFRSNI